MTTCTGKSVHYVLYAVETCGYESGFMWIDECTDGILTQRILNKDFVCYFDVPSARPGHINCTTAEVGLEPFVTDKKRAGIDCIIAGTVFGSLSLLGMLWARNQWVNDSGAPPEEALVDDTSPSKNAVKPKDINAISQPQDGLRTQHNEVQCHHHEMLY